MRLCGFTTALTQAHVCKEKGGNKIKLYKTLIIHTQALHFKTRRCTRHESIGRSGGTDPLILLLGTYIEVSGHDHSPAALPQSEEPLVPNDYGNRVVPQQTKTIRVSNLLSLPIIEPRSLACPARRLVTLPPALIPTPLLLLLLLKTFIGFIRVIYNSTPPTNHLCKVNTVTVGYNLC